MSTFGLLKTVLPLAVVALLAPSAVAWNNGDIGKLPPMGFNTWNRFQCNINEQLIHDTAQQMKDKGFLDAGYKFINLDDCWLEKNRSADGHLVSDAKKFPSGLKNLTQYLKGLGFKAGIYEDQGTLTCANYPGSLDHELTDARDFVDWGFEYAKIDNCWHEPWKGTDQDRFKRWTDALTQVHQETGVWMYYSFVEWQSFDAYVWGKDIANTYRMYDDIQPEWSSIATILNNASFIGDRTNFWARSDLDMLENGNGQLTLAEQRSHFTAWALAKSPTGRQFSKLSAESAEILLNKEIIAINQDNVIGEPLKPFFWGKNPDKTWDPKYPAQYWSGYHVKDGKQHTVIMYINVNEQPVHLNFTLSRSPHLNGDKTYDVYDLM